MWARLLPIAFLALLSIGAVAQSPPSANDPGLHTLRQPYDIETFGMFRMLILAGDFSPKVTLEAVVAKHPTTGVGAVADARGEIAIYDSRLIVSYGKQAAEAERAALFTVGTVSAWQTIKVEHDVAPDDIESFLSQTAGAHGIDPQGPFPFQIRGTLMSFVMRHRDRFPARQKANASTCSGGCMLKSNAGKCLILLRNRFDISVLRRMQIALRRRLVAAGRSQTNFLL
jgi:hypothetical protein